MKRSDMLRELVHTMGSYASWEDQCDYMLTIIEEKGMIPPSYPKPIVDKYAEPGDYQSCFEWEPEDEEK